MSNPHRRTPLSTSPSAKHNAKAISSPANPPETPAPHPAPDDRDAWKAYWAAQGQPWRTEPEIDLERQEYLAQRLTFTVDIQQGIYPFNGIKLSRADVEWLLATHAVLGPVDWKDVLLREHEGLDLRGADLRQVDLSYLPLALLRGGLNYREWATATEEQRNRAAVRLEEADLKDASLKGASLRGAHLEGAHLRWVQLEGADLMGARLEGSYLRFALLEKAHLRDACLEKADLRGALLAGAYLDGIMMCDVNHVGPLLADAQWNNVNLAVVKWSQMEMLGDEYKARQKTFAGKTKERDSHQEEYEEAVRANRQLAVALQTQGVNEEASRFFYRAQVLQKRALWFQMVKPQVKLRQRMRVLAAWFFSWFLFLIAGYGYRPSRSFLAYFLVISGFATAYYLLGHTVGPALSPLGAFVFSMTSFHGRGFFPGNNISLDGPLTVLAALEALVGLIIEVTFIATLTQRFFNR